MKSRCTVFILLPVSVLSLISVVAAQPQYYNLDNGTNSNSFPFNIGGGKAINSLFLAGEFNKPSPLPAGQAITRVYFRTSSAGTRTFTNLHILMAQDTITALTTGTFYPGPYDTVYSNPSVTLTSTVGGWMAIALDHPFNYNPTKSLITFVGQCGATGSGMSLYNSALSGFRRTWSIGGWPFVPYASADPVIMNFGVDVAPAQPQYYNANSAGIPNTLPFGLSVGYKTQHLIGPGEYGQPSPAPAGGITRLYIHMASTGGPATYTDLTIKMGQTAITTFPAGTYSGQLDVVYYSPSVTLASTSNTWMGITLGAAFYYDPAQSLVIEISQCGFTGTGMSVYQSAGTAGIIRRNNHDMTTPGVFNYFNQDSRILQCGVDVVPPVGVAEHSPHVPVDYQLLQNYPNPFNPTTTIQFTIVNRQLTIVKVYDLLGREVATPVNEVKEPGTYTVQFDAASLASGVYFYRLSAGPYVECRKMVLMK